MISCGCRYGREDLDVLGLTFQKDLLLCVRQIWPESDQSTKKIKTKSNRGWRRRFKEPGTKGEDPNVENQPELLERVPDNPNSGDVILTSGFDHSYAQRRLMARLGPKAYPFRIKLPPFAPSSITIQPSEEEADKLCGVTYELTAFIGKRISESTMQNSSVSILIRKLTPGPPIDLRPIRSSCVRCTRAPMSECYGTVSLTLNLESSLFYHDEDVSVQLDIDNASRLSVRKVRLSIVQIAELYMVTKGTYRSVVDSVRVRDGIPISSGTTGWAKKCVLHTSLSDGNKKRGLALDGLLKNEKVTLASSTIYRIPPNGTTYHETMRSTFGDIIQSPGTQFVKEMQGIIISYVVRAQCWVGLSVITLQIPFLLMHPSWKCSDFEQTQLIAKRKSPHSEAAEQEDEFTRYEELNLPDVLPADCSRGQNS
ncbi:Beta-arrestin [Fasciola hepatica]|uniref:Beta-arrestin n=1 Tax=Fasciola hepatica TaxID=6192 RepID=A0A4E0S1I7_FASHE|nr:Beta-arrestin [Fasciola hepatica]